MKSCLPWDSDRLLLTPRDEGSAEMEDVQHVDKDIVAGATSSSVTSEAWDLWGIEGTEDFNNIDSINNDEEKPVICPLSLDIISWYEKVVNPGAKFLPLTPTSFEGGVIGGLHTNDILMIKDLIAPPVYI
jgi:hypothetical protein